MCTIIHTICCIIMKKVHTTAVDLTTATSPPVRLEYQHSNRTASIFLSAIFLSAQVSPQPTVCTFMHLPPG